MHVVQVKGEDTPCGNACVIWRGKGRIGHASTSMVEAEAQSRLICLEVEQMKCVSAKYLQIGLVLFLLDFVYRLCRGNGGTP